MATKSSFKSLAATEEYPFEIKGIEDRYFVAREDEILATINNTDTEIVFKHVPKGKQVKHDALPYVKFLKESAEKLKDLSVPASNLLYLIIARLEINSKQICLNEDDFLDHCNYAKTSIRMFYLAVTELAERNVIKKKAGFQRCFWVNANYIYNGDRTKIEGALTLSRSKRSAIIEPSIPDEQNK